MTLWINVVEWLRSRWGLLRQGRPLPAPVARARKQVRRGVDLAFDAIESLTGMPQRLDNLARRQPAVDVLFIAAYEKGSLVPAAVANLSRSKHDLHFLLGSRDPEAEPAIAIQTTVVGMDSTKWGNVNRLLTHAPDPLPRWTIIADSDIPFDNRFLDRFVALCEHFDLQLAQPCQSRASYAAWRVTRRRPLVLHARDAIRRDWAVVAIRSDVASELLPFPDDAGMGWGLDQHWGGDRCAAGLAARRARCHPDSP